MSLNQGLSCLTGGGTLYRIQKLPRALWGKNNLRRSLVELSKIDYLHLVDHPTEPFNSRASGRRRDFIQNSEAPASAISSK